MSTRNRTSLILTFLLISFSLSLPGFRVQAAPTVRIEVKTILASNKNGDVDPRLRDLVRELRSVFRYSSYKLIGRDGLNLGPDRPERISLPGGRMMAITLKGLSGDRSVLRLEIFRRNKQIFQTVIQLRNRSSVTVGGPNYQGGYLLFNIYNSF
jgi:hypothetical protein